MTRYPSKQKAIDHALWNSFNHRFQGQSYGVVLSSKGDYLVLPTDHVSFEKSDFEIIPKHYCDMDYKHIKQIAMDDDPLNHWEEILGMFSVLHGEILRFILEAKIPLEKFIRWELASRGYDKNHQWCGFEKAKEIWLK